MYAAADGCATLRTWLSECPLILHCCLLCPFDLEEGSHAVKMKEDEARGTSVSKGHHGQ